MDADLPVAKQRFYYLDSVRGLAALSVIVWHFITTFTDPERPGMATASPLHFFWYGEADVVFFFIHSGFILAYSYTGPQKPLTVTSYTRFLIERIFRIYPLFIFILFISFFLKNSIFPLTDGTFTDKHIQLFWSRHYNIWVVLKEAILFIAIPKDGSLRLVPQDWTLTVEIVVGAFIPFMAFLVRKNKWLYWIAVFTAIVLLHLSTYIFEFACGVFLFYHWPYIRQVWKRMNGFLKVGAALLSIVLYTCLFYFSSLFNLLRVLFRPGIDRFIVIAGCCLFFSIVISSSTVQKLLSLPILVKIGRICYSVYLVHMVLLICFADYFMQLLHRWFILPGIGYLLVSFIVYIALTILISLVTYSLIEKPFNKIGKSVSRKIGILLARIKTRVPFLDSPVF
jgi:peptidoglycan/LPS O-acetylase OafA/YrhL